MAELFPRRDILKPQSPKVSLLTELLERCPKQQLNPFQVYAKFDGNVSSIFIEQCLSNLVINLLLIKCIIICIDLLKDNLDFM